MTALFWLLLLTAVAFLLAVFWLVGIIVDREDPAAGMFTVDDFEPRPRRTALSASMVTDDQSARIHRLVKGQSV